MHIFRYLGEILILCPTFYTYIGKIQQGIYLPDWFLLYLVQNVGHNTRYIGK